MPRFQGENFEKNLEVVRRVEELARGRGVTSAQLALAWVLARGEHIVAIPGTRSRERLEENAAAADLVLSAADLHTLDQAFPPDSVAGTRYPEQAMRTLNG